MDDLTLAKVRDYAQKYVELSEEIAQKQAQQASIKNEIRDLAMTDLAVTKKLVCGTATVEWVKGRRGSSELDRAKLVQLGVMPDVLEAATITKPDGEPSVRISKTESGHVE